MNVVTNIIDISNIEAGRLEIAYADFDLHDLVESTRALLASGAGEKGVRLGASIDEQVPRAVRGDRLRVGQVLTNLLSNALKFTPEGTVLLEVSVAEHTNVAMVVRFEVHDTGIGVEPERLATLFDPITQADLSTARQFGGTGLGLAISRELTRLMGGTIGAESAPGAGSTFYFSVPFVRANMRGHRILVAEDNEVNRMFVERLLSRSGQRVANAGNGREVLALLDADGDGYGYDLIIMDCQMPLLDGYETTREIRRREAATGRPRVPIVAMTAAATEDIRRKCLAAGMDDYMTKPLGDDDLQDVIARWLSSRGD